MRVRSILSQDQEKIMKFALGKKPTSEPTTTTETAPQLLRIREVMRRVGLSRATIYRMEMKREFPRRVRISAGSVGWRSSDIDAFIDSRKPKSDEHTAAAKKAQPTRANTDPRPEHS